MLKQLQSCYLSSIYTLYFNYIGYDSSRREINFVEKSIPSSNYNLSS